MDATSKIQHRIDLINIAFLYLPRISERFKEDYINKGQNDIFQYNYQDRLIINMGYSYNYNSVGGLLLIIQSLPTRIPFVLISSLREI